MKRGRELIWVTLPSVSLLRGGTDAAQISRGWGWLRGGDSRKAATMPHSCLVCVKNPFIEKEKNCTGRSTYTETRDNSLYVVCCSHSCWETWQLLFYCVFSVRHVSTNLLSFWVHSSVPVWQVNSHLFEEEFYNLLHLLWALMCYFLSALLCSWELLRKKRPVRHNTQTRFYLFLFFFSVRRTKINFPFSW